MFMSKIGQANKEFVLCVLTETSSTLDVLFHCLKRINGPISYLTC